jgi:hypothetical protein
MIRMTVLSYSILFVFILSAFLFGQQDTTLTITSEGKVGIGITNPEQKLHVAGGAQFDKVGPEGRLLLRSINRNDPGRFGIRFLNNQIAPFEGEDIGDQIFGFFSGWSWTRQYDAVIEIHGKSTTNWGKYLRLTHNGTDGYVTTDAGNIIINPIDGEGRVGIGTTSPIDKLEVEGGPITFDGAGGISGVRFRQNDKMMWTFFTAEWLETNDFRLRNENTGADVMTFDYETNNVGIRTTNPLGTLDVNGSIYQRGKVLHADYVFEPDYELESIEEHSEFMRKNKHLRAIPKAKTDVNGLEIVEVGAHRKGIVEELEKAHIYIDQLHQRIKAMEEKLNTLATQLESNN